MGFFKKMRDRHRRKLANKIAEVVDAIATKAVDATMPAFVKEHKNEKLAFNHWRAAVAVESIGEKK
jgi:hypothetical protein